MSNDNKEKKFLPRVYIVGGGFEYIRLMYNLGCDGAKNLYDADIVLFTGGEDVNPELYGEEPLAKTHFNRLRDEKEQAIYKAALDRKIPMVGICRGGQFLNVMNGGKLWQHVTNHAGLNHLAHVQVPPFTKGKKPRVVNVTSTHHQMMIPAEHGMVLLTAAEATEKHSQKVVITGAVVDKRNPDVEAVFYDDTACLCFQPHPEFHSAPVDCVDLFEEFLESFIYPRIPDEGTIEEDLIPPKVAAGSKKKEK